MISTTNAYDVNCNFDNNNACLSPRITAISTPYELAEIIGQPSNYVDNSPKILDFSDSPIFFVPTDLFNHLTNVQSFKASSSSITTLHSNAFTNCASLTDIHMSMNTISNVAASIAEQCINLQNLQLPNNKISTIDEDALKGLVNLDFISLGYNQLECLPPYLFQYNKKLESIFLNHNKIKTLHPALFRSLPMIFQINLQNNQVGYLPDLEFDFANWVKLILNFYLYENPIMAINPQFLTHWFNNPHIANKRISMSFTPDSPSSVTTCVTPNNPPSYNQMDMYLLNQWQWQQQDTIYSTQTPCYSNFSPQMADNSLVTCATRSVTSSTTTQSSCPSSKTCRYFLDAFKRYTCVLEGVDGVLTSITGTHEQGQSDATVERVFFINSQLRKVPSILFQKFPNFNYLYIRNCGLGIIDDQTFTECGNLQYLDASYNEIIHVRDTSLRNCTKLQRIDLTGNTIDYLSTEVYRYEPNLKVIHLNRIDDLVLD